MKSHFIQKKELEENIKLYKEEGEEHRIKGDELSKKIVHLSDLSSPARNWELSYVWSKRVTKEFIQQNNKEKMVDYIKETPFM